jgi:hypothetical protein
MFNPTLIHYKLYYKKESQTINYIQLRPFFSLEQKFIQYHHYTGHILFAFDLGIDNT